MEIGWGSSYAFFPSKGCKRYIDILEKEIKQQSLINIQGWTKKDYTFVLKSIQCFGLQYTIFFHMLKPCFELSRMK